MGIDPVPKYKSQARDYMATFLDGLRQFFRDFRQFVVMAGRKFRIDCPSTPAAPRLAFTCLYASHTSRLSIQYGFALSMEVIPLRVAAGIEQNDDAPLVRSHYRTINPTTGISAPVPRIGTRTLTATDRLGFSLRIGTTGSCVPYRSLS